MDAQGMQTILSATPTQIRMLEQKLNSGYRFPFALQLGDEFAPTAMPAFLRREAERFQLAVETPLRYRGTAAPLRRFAESGRHDEVELSDLFAFVRQHFATQGDQPAAKADEVGERHQASPPRSARRPALAAEQVTDLREARRQLDRRTAPSHVLLDRQALLNGLRQRIHGQDAVLDIVAERVCVELAKSGRSQSLSFFLFGPSGVGKTETALALAEVLSSTEIGVPHRLVRHNMNEYQERHSAYRFVGAPPSYVGYGDEPRLLQELRISPRLVVVFDEIEKAHPDILQTLMALIDTGELSCPAAGGGTTTADFRQCILIFTSNLGGAATQRLAERGLDMASIEFQIAARNLLVSQRVPPEIAGRIRSLLLFRELDAAELLAIVADKVQACGRMFGLTVRRVSPVLLADLAAQAKSKQFGVRIAEQLIEQTVAPAFVHYLRGETEGDNVELTASGSAIIVIPA